MLPVCALAIGGLDPGGGAGILADMRAFEAAGVFGCAVVALATVQSTDGLRSSVATDARLVIRQAEEVVRVQRVRVIKIGALGSLENVRAVARWLTRHPEIPVVLDPVIAPTRGRSRLLARDATAAMRDELLPRATLVTANAPEAAALAGARVTTLAEARKAATELVVQGARAALVKGGHLVDDGAVDVLAVAGGVIELRSKRLALPSIHGGGCVLASLIAARLAKRDDFEIERHVAAAVRGARRIHQRALRDAVDVGGRMRVLMP